MGVKTIEAEYTVHATQYWEVEHIEGWPRDSHGPLSIDTAEHFYIKWGLLHVQWEKDGKFEEYEPTAEDNGDGMDYKWPDAEYIDGERMD